MAAKAMSHSNRTSEIQAQHFAFFFFLAAGSSDCEVIMIITMEIRM